MARLCFIALFTLVTTGLLGSGSQVCAARDVRFSSATFEGAKSCKDKYPANKTYERAYLDIINQKCWSCPKGYSRTMAPSPNMKNACKKPNPMVKAKFHSKATGALKNQCKGSPWLRQKKCWTCPSGYRRSLKMSGEAPLCNPRVKHRRAKAIERGQPGCKDGHWSPKFSGKCYTCPAGYKRNLARFNHDRDNDAKACLQSGPPPWFGKLFVSKRRGKLDQVLKDNQHLVKLAGQFVNRLRAIRADNDSAEGLRAITPAEFMQAGGGDLLEAACEKKFCTVTITGGADGSYFVGANVSGGIAFGAVWETDSTNDGNDKIDKNKDLASTGILTANLSGGTSVGGDAALNIGFWTSKFNEMKGFAHGIVIGGSAYQIGGNASAWWLVRSNFKLFDWGAWFDFAEDEKDVFGGFSIGYQGGLSAEGEYNWGYTWNWGEAVSN